MHLLVRIRVLVGALVLVATLVVLGQLGWLAGRTGEVDPAAAGRDAVPSVRPKAADKGGRRVASAGVGSPGAVAGPAPVELRVFEHLLARHENATCDGFVAGQLKRRAYREGPSFEPTNAAFFPQVSEALHLTPEEISMFRKNGFVAVHPRALHTFASAYFRIYSLDLPVLVTTDSLLHALHSSCDDILMELESVLFTYTLGSVLERAHGELGRRAWRSEDAPVVEDVDLYLTIARNLLAGAGGPAGERDARGRSLEEGELRVEPKRVARAQVLALLDEIRSLKFNNPVRGESPTRIYGGERYPDFSQFQVRGHYAADPSLRNYFRTMMWLGRVDCGWNVLPPADQQGMRIDSDRELRDAVLFCELLRDANGVDELRSIDDIINFIVGRSDNLTVFAMLEVMAATGGRSLQDTRDARTFAKLRTALLTGQHAAQRIRSQLVVSNPGDPMKVPPPSVFQVFGQRFAIDSFVLSQVVYDSILFQDVKQRRMMPSGLDVMAALGNDAAVPLLESELREWNYPANLMAAREYVAMQPQDFWRADLYHSRLACLRTLHADLADQGRFPEVMRTEAWQMKQLQAQLGSWAELRHDTLLYAKQSYSGMPACEYPAGYVEPYPEFYARLRLLADTAEKLFAKVKPPAGPVRDRNLAYGGLPFSMFFGNMSTNVAMLETLARKELAGRPFSAEETAFIKAIVDNRGGGSGPPRYDGWYCRLFFQREDVAKWSPVVADVHTDPESNACLEVGTGRALVGVVAIDNGPDRSVYVGPWYSYYEFRRAVGDGRLTDQAWQQLLSSGGGPGRPTWVKSFEASQRGPDADIEMPPPPQRRGWPGLRRPPGDKLADEPQEAPDR